MAGADGACTIGARHGKSAALPGGRVNAKPHDGRVRERGGQGVQGQVPPQHGPEGKTGAQRRARAAVLAAGISVRQTGVRKGFGPPLGALAGRLAGAMAHEIEDRRAFLFLPIGFAIGAGAYFAAPYEPLPYVGLVPAFTFAALALWSRARPFGFHLFAWLAVIALGFAASSLQVQSMAHPVLAETLNAAEVTGFVEAAEQRPRGSRITLAVTGFTRPMEHPPERVRVTLAGRDPPSVGSHVKLRASLGPPPGPAYPGGFDFGRSIWFDGIGATGFALGRPQASPAPRPLPWRLRAATWLDEVRHSIAERIRHALPGPEGGVAVALVTGLRDAVGEPIEESMRISGLSHVLSISGLHMALVASTVFFLVRALLALVPGLALSWPIKSWAAVPAALSASFYLLLSGVEVPTQRAYVMTLLVLAGVMLGRPALTLRTLAVAALVVMALTPWAVLDPGAQMSFAATLALVAAYERFGSYVTRPPGVAQDGSWLGMPRLGMPVRYVAALVLASLAAGLATAPYAAFHFQRLAPLSLLANLAAMPVVSFAVMPAGLIGSVLMPFGWDAPAWHVMGWGLGVMQAISDAVAALPGADRGVRAMPAASIALFSLALVVLCLSRTRLILLAPACAAVAVGLAAMAPRPDLLVDAQARTVAVRGPDGMLDVMGDRLPGLSDRFAVEQWLNADGDRARVGKKELVARAACDAIGCTLPLADGHLVALSRHRDSLEDDCRLAAILVTPFAPPRDCAATVIRVDTRNPTSSVAGYLFGDDGERFIPGRPAKGTRPWEPDVRGAVSEHPGVMIIKSASRSTGTRNPPPVRPDAFDNLDAMPPPDGVDGDAPPENPVAAQ
ncbi:DUF4131 domain-containing protein [Starkeya sp. 3C]|uniref:DUF4131 domain-containing protein n=1 Tax=Ancylobacter moscoviensis TaxID=2597768 RepID=A0ABY3DPL9_9HYPH|nr:ComEC/Rec2 family competence protein [Ancylobacter moscoviensis]TSJ61462.1 DUF4131 domain-containing protein [Ancylobacter moscoviensis]